MVSVDQWHWATSMLLWLFVQDYGDLPFVPDSSQHGLTEAGTIIYQCQWLENNIWGFNGYVTRISSFSVMQAWQVTFYSDIYQPNNNTAHELHNHQRWRLQCFHVCASRCIQLPTSIMKELQTFHMLLLLRLIRLPGMRTQCLSTEWVLGGEVGPKPSLCGFFHLPSSPHSSPTSSPLFPSPNLSQLPFLKRPQGEVIGCRNATAHCVSMHVCVPGVYTL